MIACVWLQYVKLYCLSYKKTFSPLLALKKRASMWAAIWKQPQGQELQVSFASSREEAETLHTATFKEMNSAHNQMG